MGRIVIPRPRRMGGLRAPTPLSALRGRSKSRGFDASDLQMVSKALDMAVAIGGGIAGAIQRAGEDDRASTRGSTGGGYLLPPGTDARILEDRRARRAAAGGELPPEAELAPAAQAFLAEQSAAPAPLPEGPPRVQQRGASVIGAGPMAPEDARNEVIGRYAAALADMESATNEMGGFDPMAGRTTETPPTPMRLGPYQGMRMAQAEPSPVFGDQAVYVGNVAARQAALRGDALAVEAFRRRDPAILNEARNQYSLILEGSLGDVDPAYINELIQRPTFKSAFSGALPARGGGETVRSETDVDYLTSPQPSAAPPGVQHLPGMNVHTGDVIPAGDYAGIRSALPVPQAPPMPMATPQPQFIPGGGQANALGRRLPSSMGRLMAMAPFVRTQADADRLMQAVATSPDVQPSGWQDALSRDYVKRAQAQVAALMPKGLGRGPKPVTALDMARLEQTRERTELIRMQQKMAQAKLDEEAAELVRQAERLKGGNARAKKMGALVDQSVFFLQNYKARSEGDMDDATWSAGAGQFAGDRPESIVAHAQRLKLPRRSIAAIRGGAPMLLRRAPTDPPPPRVLMSQGERRLRQNSIVKHDTDAVEASGNVRQLQGYLTKTPRELKALGLTREGIESKIEVQKKLADIAKSAAESDREALKADREAREQGTTSVPSGAVYTAPTGGETEQEKFNRLNALLE